LHFKTGLFKKSEGTKTSVFMLRLLSSEPDRIGKNPDLLPFVFYINALRLFFQEKLQNY